MRQSGANTGRFAHDTGEGGISRYHKQGGGDLIYQIGSGYFGCRGEDGRIDPDKFAGQVASPQVKLSNTSLGALLALNSAVAEIAEIDQCRMIAGAFDYLIKVRTSDIQSYRKVLAESI